MAKTSGEFEKEFIDTAKTITGRSVPEWLEVLKATGNKNRNELIALLRDQHSLNYLQAQLTVGMFLNNGQPVYVDEQQLLDNQFAKLPEMRPLFEAIHRKLLALYPDTQLIPKKTYISYTMTREYAAINIKKGELRLGIDLGDEAFNTQISAAKLTGPMPRISHMAVLKDEKDFDATLAAAVQRSYARCHK